MAECVRPFVAPVAKLVDAPDLGSGAERRTGSSPARRTISQYRHIINSDYLYFLRKGAMNAVPSPTRAIREKDHRREEAWAI